MGKLRKEVDRAEKGNDTETDLVLQWLSGGRNQLSTGRRWYEARIEKPA